MKIIYASDVHGDFKSLEKFRDYAKDNADVVVCSGDLLSFTLKENQMGQLGGLTQALLGLRKAKNITDSLEVMTQKISEMDEVPDELKAAAQRYQRLQKLVKAKAKKQYQNIKEIFDSFNTTVFTIPGNWDIQHLGDALHHESLHDKTSEEKGVIFGGYGGSSQMMTGILPLDLGIPFDHKEVYETLCKLDPDVAVVHCPPYKILDRSSRGDHCGSLGVLSYVLEEQPNLLLVGHIHEDIGVKDKNLTAIINPGNLGNYGNDNFGTFMEIFTGDNNYFKEANLRNIEDPNKVILNYVLTKEGIKKVK